MNHTSPEHVRVPASRSKRISDRGADGAEPLRDELAFSNTTPATAIATGTDHVRTYPFNATGGGSAEGNRAFVGAQREASGGALSAAHVPEGFQNLGSCRGAVFVDESAE